jgi:hypothetical protein
MLVPLAGSGIVPQLYEFKTLFIANCCRYQQKYQQADARY